MDWRYPNVGCLSFNETIKPNRDCTRYARSVKNPPLYNLCIRDYDRDHRPRDWPSGTEYQFAYCSNYRAQQAPVCPAEQQDRISCSWPKHADIRAATMNGDTGFQPFYKLYDVHPPPIMDKHYRGSKYNVDDPLGVLVPEELSQIRQTLHGTMKLSCQDDLNNVFTTNHRYKEWISRPIIDIKNELEGDIFFCKLPEAPSKYWDFYNVVRMRRPAKESLMKFNFQPCRFLPLSINKDMPDIPPAKANPHLGSLSIFKLL